VNVYTVPVPIHTTYAH